MTDLLDQDAVDDFRAAMGDVAETFQRSPVVLKRQGQPDVELLAGLKPDTDSAGGGEHGELEARETGLEVSERILVTIGWEQLRAKGLLNGARCLITVDDRLTIGGRRFNLDMVQEGTAFRGEPLNVVLKAVR